MVGTEEQNTPPPPPPKKEEDKHPSPRDSKGWDGKLRVEKRPVMTNPEAISDPEYSDEENVLPGETISADEGTHGRLAFDAEIRGLKDVSRST